MKEVPTFYYNQNTSEKIEIKSKWWGEPMELVHAHVFGVVRAIKERQIYREMQYLKHARLYQNQEILGLMASRFNREKGPLSLENRVTLNIVKACIDTLMSKIGTQKPRPLFLTEGGDWSKARQAKNLTFFCDGWFDEHDVYSDAGLMRFRDGCVFGTGGLKLFPNQDKTGIECERVFMPEIIVDDVEGIYGKPRQLHQEKNMHREVLKEMFPDKSHRELRRAIDAVQGALHGDESNSSADMVPVIESWHLPSGPGAKDGKHAICIPNRTLVFEDWDRPYFPFVFWQYTPRLLGFYGQSLTEELVGIQIEINKILRKIQEVFHLGVNPQIWLEYASKPVVSRVNNQTGSINFYQGQPPLFFTPPGLPPEVYQHLENLWRKGFETTGISLLSATGKKPAGVEAGVALRTLQDIETERFAMTEESNTQFYMRVSDMLIDMTARLAEESPNLSIKARDRNRMLKLQWKEIKLAKEDYIMRRYPTNLLPTQPAGKFERIQEMLQIGFLDRPDAYALLDYPDLKQVTSLNTAPREFIMQTIEDIMAGKEVDAPDPDMLDLTYAARVIRLALGKAKIDGAPESVLEALRNYKADIDTLLDKAMGNQAAPADPMAQGAPPLMPDEAPLAQPEALPVSELLPIDPAMQNVTPQI